MHKTLLLVFVHGFKGGEDTFGTFPDHLRALLSHALPNVSVVAVTYPKFETRGELQECVGRFREWLENKVIDLEVANGTPSPTVDPSVHTILVGHSMGGIVAAETLLLLSNEQPLQASTASGTKNGSKSGKEAAQSKFASTSEQIPEPDLGPLNLMFPHIQGLIAYDTPFLGLAPEMIAHGLEGGHKIASSAYNTYSEVASMFGWGAKNEATVATAAKTSAGALPAPPTANVADAAAAPKWSSWGKYAMFAGAAGAVAAGGAAALYSQKEKLSAGWAWAGSHLLFVGDLAKAERLRLRVEAVNKQCTERGIGSANLYTNLGRGAREGYGFTETLSGKDRTFCNLPTTVKEGREQSKTGMIWIKAVNEKAQDETTAHMSMFFPKDNPGFYVLGEASKEIISSWIDEYWYKSSGGKANEDELNETVNPGSIGKDWEGIDTNASQADDEGLQMREEEADASKDSEDMMQEGSIIIDKSPTNSTTLEGKAAEGRIPVT